MSGLIFEVLASKKNNCAPHWWCLNVLWCANSLLVCEGSEVGEITGAYALQVE